MSGAPRTAAALTVVVAVGGGVAGIVAAHTGIDLLRLVGLLVAALVVAAAAGFAVKDYATLVLLLLVIRPELDAVGHGSASVIGLIFIAASLWWLWSRWSQDRLVAPSPAVWALVAFVLAALLSTLGSHLPVTSASASTRLGAGVLMFVVVEQLVRSRTLTAGAVHRALAASAVLVCLHVVVQMITGTSPIDDETGLSRVTGPFVHPSVLGKYMAVIAVVLAAQAAWSRAGHRILWAGGAVAAWVVVLLTFTRAAWVAAALGLVVIAARKDRRLLPAVLGVSVVAIAVVPSLNQRITDVWDPAPPPPGAPESSLAWRWDYWQALMPLGRLNPVTGIGLDVVPSIRSERLLPHNVWVQTWVELGLVGLAALVGVVVATVVTLRRAGPRVRGTAAGATAAHEAAIAVGLGLVTVTLTENLLDETTTLWCAGAVLAAGWSVARGGADPRRPPWWLGRSGWRARRPRHVRRVPSG